MNQTEQIDKRSWAVRKRAFHIWQRRPHEVAPMSDVRHTCKSCRTAFQGNFCPRCGQAARVGRFSFKTATLLFLDIWGVGNRGMFRTIRDLMLRPGYMIRDYVSGKQSAYFPPFKMFFILATFSLLLSHGVSLNIDEQQAEKTEKVEKESININGKEIENKTTHLIRRIPKYIALLEKKSPALFAFIMLVLVSAPLFVFFRRCPAIPDLRYSEHLVALVYTSNTYSLYSMLAEVMPIHTLSSVLKLMAVVMIFISLKQFTGYSKRRLFLYIMLTGILFAIIIAGTAALVFAIAYGFSGQE